MQRAEHEYHTLMVTLPAPTAGQIVVNELMADNTASAYDANGESNDWIEIYNTTTTGLNLSGLYLSDDIFNLAKWQFPSGTGITANQYLIVWADNDTLQSGLHANFKLGINGESVIISDGVTVLDGIDFPIQTTDVAYARCPDAGTFTYGNPTFAASNNCFLSISEDLLPLNVSVYPVPTSGNVFISSHEEGKLQVQIIDLHMLDYILNLIDFLPLLFCYLMV